MRKSTILGCLALAAAVAVAAGAAETKKAAHTRSTGAKSFTGCLEKGDDANSFKLTHTGGTEYEIIGAPATLKMSEHVGHKVEVSGTTVSTASAAKMEKTTPSKEAGEHHLKVTALKHISPTCP